MKVLLNIYYSDEQLLIKIKSRPNVGDRIYLSDLKNYNNLSKELRKYYEHSCSSFEIDDIVWGKSTIYDEGKKNRWIIQGEIS